jgi:hypothetical protein
MAETEDTVRRYLHDNLARCKHSAKPIVDTFRRSPLRNSMAWFDHISITADSLERGAELECGETFTVHFHVMAAQHFPALCLSLQIINERGENVATLFSLDEGVSFKLKSGINHLACTVDELPLAPGQYFLSVGMNTDVVSKALDALVEYPAFAVGPPTTRGYSLAWNNRPWGGVHWTAARWSSVSASAP